MADRLDLIIHGWSKEEVELLDKTTNFIKSNFVNRPSDKQIEEYFERIKNKNSRINDLDKKWVACDEMQEHERSTAVKAILEIIGKTIYVLTGGINDRTVSVDVDRVCKLMNERKITHKPRIAFYIMVLWIIDNRLYN